MSEVAEVKQEEVKEPTMAELREQAMQEIDGDKGQPRDEQGRFVAAEKKEEAAPVVEDAKAEEQAAAEPEIKLFRRVIDIGDGAGPEVFEAESLEDLLDKIADAKANATKKIREQQRELNEAKAKNPVKKETREFTDEDEHFFSQEILSKPTQATRKMFKEMAGFEIEELKAIKAEHDKIKEAEQKKSAADYFIASHPDYVDSERNTKLLLMATQGKEITSENFHKAYLDLKQSGLLELKTEKASAEQEEKPDQQARIAAASEATTPPQRTRTSGITTQNRTQPAVRRAETSEEEFEKLPPQKQRELLIKNWDSF